MIGRREFPHQLPPLTLVSGRGSSVRVRAIRGSLCLPHIVLSSGSFKFPRHRPTPHAPSQNEWLFVAEVGRHCITRAEKLLGTYFGSWAKSWYNDTYAAVKEYHTAHAARCDEECPQKETESRAIPSIWISAYPIHVNPSEMKIWCRVPNGQKVRRLRSGDSHTSSQFVFISVRCDAPKHRITPPGLLGASCGFKGHVLDHPCCARRRANLNIRHYP